MAKFKTIRSPVSLTVSVDQDLHIAIDEYRLSLQPLPPNFTPLIRYLLTLGLQTARAQQAALRAPSPPDLEPTNLPPRRARPRDLPASPVDVAEALERLAPSELNELLNLMVGQSPTLQGFNAAL
jgi:hypothetical protein